MPFREDVMGVNYCQVNARESFFPPKCAVDRHIIMSTHCDYSIASG